METYVGRHRQNTHKKTFHVFLICFQFKIRSQTAMVIRLNWWSTDCNYTNNSSGKHQSTKSIVNHRTDGILGPDMR